MIQWKVVILTLADEQACGYCVPDVGSCPAEDLCPAIFFYMEFHGIAHVIENMQYSAKQSRSQSTPYPWTSDITQLPFVYKVTTSPKNYTDFIFYSASSVCDKHSHSTAHTSLSYQVCIKCSTPSQEDVAKVHVCSGCV